MGFFDFLKRESKEDPMPGLMEGMVSATERICWDVIFPWEERYVSLEDQNLKSHTQSEIKGFPPYSELLLYLYFRLDYAISTERKGESIRRQLGEFCYEAFCIGSDLSEAYLSEQFDIRINRYANVANALHQGKAKYEEFVMIMSGLAFSFIKRALKAGSYSDWRMTPKTAVTPLGLIERMNLEPEFIRIENKYIGPLILRAIEACR